MTSRTSWIWLLCIALLAVRIGGAHLHLCFDGSEPPVAMHVGDVVEHGAHDMGSHSDTDLNLVDNGIAKSLIKIGFMPLLFAALLLFILPVSAHRIFQSNYQAPPIPAVPHRLRSPRAPPR